MDDDFTEEFAPHKAYVARYDNWPVPAGDARGNTYDLLDLYFTPAVHWQQADARPWHYAGGDAYSRLYFKPPVDRLPSNETSTARAIVPQHRPSERDLYGSSQQPPWMWRANCFSG